MHHPTWKACTKCGNEFYADQSWKRICIPCWKESKGINNKRPFESPFRYQPPPQQPLIDAEMLRRLIFLCHPDKHNNSQAAKLATEWLLKQRP